MYVIGMTFVTQCILKNNMKIIQTKNVGYGGYLVLEDDLIGRFISNYGWWEIHLLEIYRHLIKPDDVILDAGANIGFHTLQFAVLGKRVYAYEPQPIIFNLLSANILLNGLTDKIEQYRFGLGDSPGKIKMQPLSMFDEKNGCHNYGGRGTTTDENGEDEIELVQFNKDVDVIKMDIQGSELAALRGMESVIDRCEPWFMIENYEEGDNDKKVLEFLINKGYVIYRPTQIVPKEDCIAFKPSLEKHKKIKELLEINQLEELKFKIITEI